MGNIGLSRNYAKKPNKPEQTPYFIIECMKKYFFTAFPITGEKP